MNSLLERLKEYDEGSLLYQYQVSFCFIPSKDDWGLSFRRGDIEVVLTIEEPITIVSSNAMSSMENQVLETVRRLVKEPSKLETIQPVENGKIELFIRFLEHSYTLTRKQRQFIRLYLAGECTLVACLVGMFPSFDYGKEKGLAGFRYNDRVLYVSEYGGVRPQKINHNFYIDVSSVYPSQNKLYEVLKRFDQLGFLADVRTKMVLNDSRFIYSGYNMQYIKDLAEELSVQVVLTDSTERYGEFLLEKDGVSVLLTPFYSKKEDYVRLGIDKVVYYDDKFLEYIPHLAGEINQYFCDEKNLT